LGREAARAKFGGELASGPIEPGFPVLPFKDSRSASFLLRDNVSNPHGCFALAGFLLSDQRVPENLPG
jgi:hypothetical protein